MLVAGAESNRYLRTLPVNHAGLAVVIAENGGSAPEIAQWEQLGVMLLDSRMLEMVGYRVVTHLKNDARLARTLVIGVSSFAMSGGREKEIPIGSAGYLEKPVDPEHFAETVGSTLGRAKGTI